jgi:hypothetical protein
LRREREPQPIEKRVDEQEQHEERTGATSSSDLSNGSRASGAAVAMGRYGLSDRVDERAATGTTTCVDSPTRGGRGARTWITVPAGVRTSTSESRPPYSTFVTSPAIAL